MKIVSGSRKKQLELVKENLSRWKDAKKSGKLFLPDDLDNMDFDSLLSRLNSTKGKFIAELTRDDLVNIVREKKRLGRKFKGGMTAQQVINRSLSEDRKRANNEIRWSTLVRRNGDVFSFVTDASQKNGATKHFVSVQFVDFNRLLTTGKNAKKVATQIANGRVKFDCDCGRHTYWFRYIATVGDFAYIGTLGNKTLGRPETALPKIRNPKLKGVACKHVLRTMKTIISEPRFLEQLTKAVELAKNQISTQQVSEKEAKETIQTMKSMVSRILTTRGRKSKKEILKAVNKKHKKSSVKNSGGKQVIDIQHISKLDFNKLRSNPTEYRKFLEAELKRIKGK